MRDVVAVILGGGQGKRLDPLTRFRSKPAVPIGGKHRLIDIPISNCLHAGIRRIFVLTQFNSASLNRHVSQTYRLDPFSHGFVDILAAEQTPDNTTWFQGTADAVRQAARHLLRNDAQYYLVLAGDNLYRMDYTMLVDDHLDSQADVTIATLPVSGHDARSMGIFSFDGLSRITAYDHKPDQARLDALERQGSAGPFAGQAPDRPFIASMGIYVFTRDVLFDLLGRDAARNFGQEIVPAALGRYVVRAYLHRGYWADVGTVRSFYQANLLLTHPDAPFHFHDRDRPIFTRPRHLPGARFVDCALDDAIVGEGCFIEHARVEQSVVGIRTQIRPGATIRRSVLLGADYYATDDAAPAIGGPALGIGRNVVLDGVIVDKNARIGDGARLTNESRIGHADGHGYCIRDGIIVVPKDAVVEPGTFV